MSAPHANAELNVVPDIDPATYVAMFDRRQPVPAAFNGVCGRVLRWTSQCWFSRATGAKPGLREPQAYTQ